MKRTIIVRDWLLAKQDEIQKEYYKLVGKENCDADGGGIWISVACANCKHDFKTPAWIREGDGGRCQKCNTKFYKKSRRYNQIHKHKKS